MKDELLEAHRNGRLMLFVGAGVSANLGLPDWNALIGRIAEELEYDPKIFATYGTPLALAEFYKKRWAALVHCAAGWTARGTTLARTSPSLTSTG